MWPQYRYWKVIRCGYVKKDLKKSQRERVYLDREIASIEPMVESNLQVLVMLFLHFSSPKCFGASDGLNWKAVYFYLKVIMSWFSTLSGGANFAINGPLHPIRKAKDGSKLMAPLTFSIQNLV